MRIGENGLNLIKEFEGCILQSYDDYNDKVVNTNDSVQGTLTIGYGHTGSDVYKGQVITQEQADQILQNDMIQYSNEVQQVIDEGGISFPVNQNIFDALVSFDYNLGQNNLRLLCGNNRDMQTVADKMLLYINPGSVWQEGLTRRRQAERQLFLTPCETQQVQNVSRETISGNNEIRQLQHQLNVQGFKDINGNSLSEDGIPGNLTLSACPTVQEGAKGTITQWIQFHIGVSSDGDFGSQTKQGVINFQNKYGLQADGIVGKQTWEKLLDIVGGQ